MDDKKKLIKLLEEFKIPFKSDGTLIVIEVDKDRVDGYWGFTTAFEFNNEQKFIGMNIYE